MSHTDDLFEQLDILPQQVRDKVSEYVDRMETGEEDLYSLCKEFQAVMQSLGYTFDYGLDGVPYDLRAYSRAPESGPTP